MSFNEGNTVEASSATSCAVASRTTPVGRARACSRRSGEVSGLGWHFLAGKDLFRQPHEVLAEDQAP